MANYIGMARSNYFKVKESESFLLFANSLPNSPEIIEDPERGFMIIFRDGGIPSFIHEIESDEYTDFCITELSSFLLSGEVAIFQEVGYEKMRYLNGFSIAFNSKGKVLTKSLNEIYHDIRREFNIEQFSFCEY